MESLATYLNKYSKQVPSSIKLNKENKEKLLKLDQEYGDIVSLFREDWKVKDIENLEEECENFLKMKSRGLDYFPQIELASENKYKTDNILPRLKQLLVEFRNFNCFLSKYYIETISEMINIVEYALDPEVQYPKYNQYKKQTPSIRNLQLAYDMLKNHPYREVPESERNMDGKTVAKLIQQHIDKLGYDWKVILNDKMISRMKVDINKTMDVNPNAKFSKADVEGLKAHEVEGHIGRRYHGYKLGLNLFVSGLRRTDVLDEGLAIYNSLHKCDEIKPNVEFNIALKIIIAYYLDKKDFCELFDMCKELAPNLPDEALFKKLVRYKRELQDCSLLGGNGDDTTYFLGYQIVKDLTDEQRSDILKYNIGPSQLPDLPNIKAFFKANKFKPLN